MFASLEKGKQQKPDWWPEELPFCNVNNSIGIFVFIKTQTDIVQSVCSIGVP